MLSKLKEYAVFPAISLVLTSFFMFGLIYEGDIENRVEWEEYMLSPGQGVASAVRELNPDASKRQVDVMTSLVRNEVYNIEHYIDGRFVARQDIVIRIPVLPSE